MPSANTLKVNIWGINYAPEMTGIAVYTTDLAEYLSEQGDQSSVVTAFPYYPKWQIQESTLPLYRDDTINSVRVHRCWLYVPNRPTVLKRIIHEASFVMASFYRQLVLPAPDIYIVVSPPLLLGFAAWLISRLKRRPFVFHVQDLQPDAAQGLDMLRQSFFMKILYWLENFAYQKAAFVSVISPQMINFIENKGVKRDKLVYFPNWIDKLSDKNDAGWRRTEGIGKDDRLVTYSGNFGVKQGLPAIVEAAKMLKGNDDIKFVFAGDGAESEKLKSLVANYGLKNVILLDVLPVGEHTALLEESDICLIPQKKGAATAFLPSKLLKILALGKPVIAIAEKDSALAQAVAEGQFGVVLEPENILSLKTLLIDLLADSQRREQMATNGRKYVEQFSRNEVLSNFRENLRNYLERINLAW